YRFVHSMFQHYLYTSMGEAERLYLHRDVGEAIEALFANQTEVVAAQLAHHFEIAGVNAKAITYRLQAGNRARRMSAHDEAIGHFNRGLQLLADLPAGPERMMLELNLQTALGTELVLTQGYASPAVEQAYDRARELCRAMGDPPQAIPVLYGLCAYSFVRADLRQTYVEAQQVFALAQNAQDSGYILGAQQLLGTTAMHLGQLDQARQHLEAVVDQYQRSQHAELAYSQGHDPAVGALSFLAFTLWQQGCPEQAWRKSEAALALAQELDHPYTIGFATSFAAMQLQMLRRWSECQAYAERALELGQRGGFPLWQSIGAIIRGLTVVQQGHMADGIAEMVNGLAIWKATGSRLSWPYQRTLLAEAYCLAGRREEGLNLLVESPDCTEELFWRPEAYRTRAALLLLAPGTESEAEFCLRKAVSMAQSQGARLLELRAATSLAQLLQRQGRCAEGYKLLSTCYQWFKEGVDTADLAEARVLLRQLAPLPIQSAVPAALAA
ncbi:MAG TPA: hypothetical protein PKE45_09265, partial [Caldilineaceae bacterium]|nr:hypothetical protein [Caldilineaceae bacterium]